MKRPSWILFMRAAMATLVVLLSAHALSAQAQAQPAPAVRRFASPEEATNALVTAARGPDMAALRAIFGPGNEGLLSSGDPVADREQLHRFAAAYDAKHSLQPQGTGRVWLVIGEDDWPLPIPIVERNGSWEFDTKAGADEIIDRRIGRNELAAIRTCLAYVDAQHDFHKRMQEKTGTGFYADRLASTPGRQDGLYWPAREGEPESPLGPLVTTAQAEGYPGVSVGGRRRPYQGYYFRILLAQGPDAPGGTKDYVQNGRMTGGFGLIAWPASYGVSGIMTFQVNQDGLVFQRDLGPDTGQIAARMQRFDPDIGWALIDLKDQ
ncbi:MAG TPA: DUF2950 domain-containing protein [Rhodopila sp.]|nr:DUF2950 domain-containing protein [Rhodopila sp.]